jgi:hypothetical protein
MEIVGLVVEVRMPGHPVHHTSQTRDELLRCIMDGAAVIRNNLEIMMKATRAALKRGRFCVVNAGHFEK